MKYGRVILVFFLTRHVIHASLRSLHLLSIKVRSSPNHKVELWLNEDVIAGLRLRGRGFLLRTAKAFG
jgi:hypothetical protein